MAVVSKEELIEKIRKVVTDETSDDVIEIYEDIDDTLSNVGDGYTKEDVEKAKKEIEEKWRKKYIERFTKSDDTDDVNEKDYGEESHVTVDDLLEESED